MLTIALSHSIGSFCLNKYKLDSIAIFPICIFGINHCNSHNKIMDFNKSEKILLLVDNNYSIFNINELIKNKNVVISINYHDIEKTNQLSISEEIQSKK